MKCKDFGIGECFWCGLNGDFQCDIELDLDFFNIKDMEQIKSNLQYILSTTERVDTVLIAAQNCNKPELVSLIEKYMLLF